MNRLKIAALLVLAALTLPACDVSDKKTMELRQQLAACRDLISFERAEMERCVNDIKNEKEPSCRSTQSLFTQCRNVFGDSFMHSNTDIVISLAYGHEYIKTMPEIGHMIDGVHFALDSINSNGGIAGRKLRINEMVGQKPSLYEKYLDIFHESLANKVAKNIDSVAAIGHFGSSEARKAAIIYELSGLLFLSMWSGHSGLTQHGFNYVFSTLPSNKIQINNIIDYLVANKFKHLAVFYDITSPGHQELTLLLSARAPKSNLHLTVNKSLRPKRGHYFDIAAAALGKEVDAIIIFAYPSEALKLIETLHNLNIVKPIISSRSMSGIASHLSKNPPQTPMNLAYPVLQWQVNGSERLVEFEHFKEKYGYAPDFMAARGYDNLMLLATTIKQEKSTVPSVLATSLRYMIEPWQGETGEFLFDKSGKLISQAYQIKKLQPL